MLDKRIGSGESHYDGGSSLPPNMFFVEVGLWVSYNAKLRDV